MARLILMGRIAAAHGLKGLVKLQSFTGEPAAIGRYGPLRDATGQRRFEVTVQNLVKGGVVARIAGVADRTAAEKLRGIELYLPREALPPAAEGEYYHADLVGLAVVLSDGTPFGVVRAVENFGAGDLLAIDRPGKGLGQPALHRPGRAGGGSGGRPDRGRSAAGAAGGWSGGPGGRAAAEAAEAAAEKEQA